jgi:hypothetical protein
VIIGTGFFLSWHELASLIFFLPLPALLLRLLQCLEPFTDASVHSINLSQPYICRCLEPVIFKGEGGEGGGEGEGGKGEGRGFPVSAPLNQ